MALPTGTTVPCSGSVRMTAPSATVPWKRTVRSPATSPASMITATTSDSSWPRTSGTVAVVGAVALTSSRSVFPGGARRPRQGPGRGPCSAVRRRSPRRTGPRSARSPPRTPGRHPPVPHEPGDGEGAWVRGTAWGSARDPGRLRSPRLPRGTLRAGSRRAADDRRRRRRCRGSARCVNPAGGPPRRAARWRPLSKVAQDRHGHAAPAGEQRSHGRCRPGGARTRQAGPGR